MDTPSKFCGLCQCIQFDDAASKGYAARDEDGNSILSFDGDEHARYFDTGLRIQDKFPDFPLLSKSAADNKCDGCGFLKDSALQALAAHGDDLSKDRKLEIRATYLWRKSEEYGGTDVVLFQGIGALELEFIILDDQGHFSGSREYVTHYVQSRSNNTVQKWLRLHADAPGPILTPTTVSWIQSQLSSCQICEEQPKDDFIPTRLIRVDCNPPSLVQMDKPTILAFSPEFIKYAALSYCWGPPEKAARQPKLEKKTIQDRMSGIPDTEMTSVLRDAITVCRALSIPFLWVDALCIIQDDPKDCERESSLMGQILLNACFTIAAWSSGSCSEGFLDRHSEALIVPFRSSIGPDIHGTCCLTTGMDDEADRFLMIDYLHSKSIERGWILQEEIMSKKILAFGHLRLHLLCGHQGQTQYEEPVHGSVLFSNYYTLSNFGPESGYDLWYRHIASQYSSRLLSRTSDRFPAISGLASFFGAKLEDEYVAGIWRKELHKGLWWSKEPDGKGLTLKELLNDISNPTPYVAPSWSWASRGFQIGFGDRNFSIFRDFESQYWRQEFEHATPHIVLAGTDPYGQLSSAELQITTRVCNVPADIFIYNQKNEGYVGGRNMYAWCTVDWDLESDGTHIKRISPGMLKLMLLGRAEGQFWPCSYSPNVAFSELSESGALSSTGLLSIKSNDPERKKKTYY
ncbi:heterokaryon incompatibility protein-domain-containing protein [Nemania diffusa]|nr:heterokaryon incompatibility protein-domain-containing protein [Nemania diffusa]